MPGHGLYSSDSPNRVCVVVVAPLVNDVLPLRLLVMVPVKLKLRTAAMLPALLMMVPDNEASLSDKMLLLLVTLPLIIKLSPANTKLVLLTLPLIFKLLPAATVPLLLEILLLMVKLLSPLNMPLLVILVNVKLLLPSALILLLLVNWPPLNFILPVALILPWFVILPVTAKSILPLALIFSLLLMVNAVPTVRSRLLPLIAPTDKLLTLRFTLPLDCKLPEVLLSVFTPISTAVLPVIVPVLVRRELILRSTMALRLANVFALVALLAFMVKLPDEEIMPLLLKLLPLLRVVAPLLLILPPVPLAMFDPESLSKPVPVKFMVPLLFNSWPRLAKVKFLPSALMLPLLLLIELALKLALPLPSPIMSPLLLLNAPPATMVKLRALIVPLSLFKLPSACTDKAPAVLILPEFCTKLLLLLTANVPLP